MSDRYTSFVNSPMGQTIAKNLGLPQPVSLDRYTLGDALVSGTVLVGQAAGGSAVSAIASLLKSANVSAATLADTDLEAELSKSSVKVTNVAADTSDKFKAVVFDATGIEEAADLVSVYEFFHAIARKIEASGRVVIIGSTPELCGVKKRTAQRALLGFIKAVGKEFKKGITANLIYLEDGADKNLESTLRFFISERSTYVSGQDVRISKTIANKVDDWTKPLAGKAIVVTGAARGIGASIAEILSRDGAHVICLDIPPAQEDLNQVAAKIGGSALPCDITADDAGERIAEAAKAHGGLHAIVHNAGVTRDKTLANMDDKRWNMVMNINLISQEKVNAYLLENNVIGKNGRIICVSSISGIAGNMGQTNYAMSKAGVIGMVEGMQGELKNGITINAVAPGFIETEMTAAIPFAIREAGRRMNSMSQGGEPVDVAEAIGWFASPASSGVKGNVVRVCGQSLIGA